MGISGGEMKLLWAALGLLVTCCVCAAGTRPASADEQALDKAARQYREYTLAQSSPDVPRAMELAGGLREDGSWGDIDYKSTQRASWVTATHVSRVLAMTCALASGKATREQSQSLEDAIHKALGYWRKNDFKCPNWWHNNIGVPKMLGPVALLLGDRIRQDEFDYITKTVMPRGAIGMTGQNRVWLAGITFVNALLLRDEKKAEEAASVIFSEVLVTTKEGIQPDFSFHQHGPQLQFGNYGLSFADDQLKWAMILRGTPWEMPAKKLDVVGHYIVDGLDWTLWRGSMDISSCGRQISPGSPESKGRSAAGYVKRLPALDPKYAAQANASNDRNKPGSANDLVGNKFFWRSDYMIHRTPHVFYSIKMCSKRVTGAESINSENLSGYYLADGATYIKRGGTEYLDIFAVWDWRRLPGVTCRQEARPVPSFVEYKIQSSFVGGVSDGLNGCAALDYTRDGVAARKTWFFVGDLMVCLGSGITAAKKTGSSVSTTINQCRLQGDVRITTGGVERGLPSGVHALENLQTVTHDGIRYTFLEPANVRLSNRPETGNWKKVFDTASTPKADVTMGVFALSVEHGDAPNGATYAYSVAPAGGKVQSPAILSNTKDIQALQIGKLVQAVFHAAGRLDLGGRVLTVDSPCAVMVNLAGSEPVITVSDPTQQLRSLRVGLDGKIWEVKLPGGGAAGKSVRVDIQERS